MKNAKNVTIVTSVMTFHHILQRNEILFAACKKSHQGGAPATREDAFGVLIAGRSNLIVHLFYAANFKTSLDNPPYFFPKVMWVNRCR